MKIIIIGDGKVGYKLARQLSTEKYDVVLICNRPSGYCVCGGKWCRRRSFKAGRYRPCGSGYRMYFRG